MTKQKRKKVFAPTVFIVTFLVLGVLTTGQMLILGNFVDYQSIPQGTVIGVIVYWLIGAVGFTLLISYQINRYFEKPMMRFAKATQKVADGDFSVYVKPLHTGKKMNYMGLLR